MDLCLLGLHIILKAHSCQVEEPLPASMKNLTSTHASVERRPSRQFSMLQVPYSCSPAAIRESSGSGQRRWPAVILFALQIPVPRVAV